MSSDKTVSSTTLVSQKTPEIPTVKRILWLLDLLYNQLLAVISVLFLWVLAEKNDTSISNKYFWHIWLSTAGYIPLMASAIILFSENNLASLYVQRTKKYWIHGVLLLLSCVIITAGIFVETDLKRSRGRHHFQVDHGKLGLASWVLIVISIVIGVLAANTKVFSSYIRPITVKFLHNFLGISAFVLGIASLYLELNFLQRYCSENVYIGSKWVLGYITVWTCLAALKSLWSQLVGIFT